MTRDEALLALNDHLGHEVEVAIQVVTEEANVWVMTAKGVLGYWREQHGEAWEGDTREDITGLYDVGGASIDITDLDAARPLADEGEPAYGLAFPLADNVELSVVWGVESPDSVRP